MAKQATTNIRIIGGSLRGRKLAVLPLPGLRPTPDRVRETLFNWLMPIIMDANCLDLCAGSGALGFEAISRGAAFVQFVDPEVAVCRQIQQYKQKFNLPEACLAIAQQHAESFIETANAQFDIVFIDPPFQQNLAVKLLTLLINSKILAENAYIYLESDKHLDLNLAQLPIELYKSKQASKVYYALYKLIS